MMTRKLDYAIAVLSESSLRKDHAEWLAEEIAKPPPNYSSKSL